MNDRYKIALQAIVDYEPEWEPWVHPDPDCTECAKAQERQWPPSRLCHVHYSPMADHSQRMQRNRDTQWMAMKDIAREALEERTA
jgi:hypothetical protein